MIINLLIALPTTVDPSTLGGTPDSLIRWSAQILGWMLLIGGTAFLLIYLSNRKAGKKRYAEIQARRAADAAAGKTDRLTELANASSRPTFINDDDAKKPAMPNIARDRFLNS